jgi:hypothetical protein
MKNEIKKFRAWDGLNKKFTYWTMNDLCNYTDDSIEKPSALDEWEEYTGEMDGNNKEICEGDIIRFQWTGSGESKDLEDLYRVVEYYYCGFHPFVDGNPNNQDCEVVGNIHENAPLLSNVKYK